MLVVAINPSLTSAEAGHSFSSKGNPFWRLLYESGLTSELLRPEDEMRLPEFGLGLVSGVQRATRAAAELSGNEQSLGAERVRQVVATLRPRYVALLGLTLYSVFFPRGMERGPGLKTSKIGEAPVFVLPNSEWTKPRLPRLRKEAHLVSGSGRNHCPLKGVVFWRLSPGRTPVDELECAGKPHVFTRAGDQQPFVLRGQGHDRPTRAIPAHHCARSDDPGVRRRLTPD